MTSVYLSKLEPVLGVEDLLQSTQNLFTTLTLDVHVDISSNIITVVTKGHIFRTMALFTNLNGFSYSIGGFLNTF